MAADRGGRRPPRLAGLRRLARVRPRRGGPREGPPRAAEQEPARSLPRRVRFDQPRQGGRGWLPTVPAYDPEVFGRLSERIARFLGTGRFIVWMTVVIITWVVWNIFAPRALRFDGYPFIFLTLMLSLQASYAAPLILLAQNRQADRDRINLEQDRARNDRSIADTEYLTREVAALRMGLGEVATRDYLRSELQGLLRELEDRRPRTDGHMDSRT